MLPAYFVNGTDNTFLTYGASGYTNISGSFAVSTGTLSSLTSGATLSSGTAILDVNTVAGTLATDISVYALRTNQNINNGAGQFNTLTLSGGTAGGGGLLAYGTATIQTNLKSGTLGQYELPVYVAPGFALTLSGDISAGTQAASGLVAAGVTKFGAGALVLAKEQSDAARGTGFGYANGWTVNEGSLTLNVFGALGNAVATNAVYLNASSSGPATLNLNAVSNNPLNATYTSGRIIALDNAVINLNAGANDRLQSIADVEIQSTGSTLLDAQLKVVLGGSLNTILQAGSLYQIGRAHV